MQKIRLALLVFGMSIGVTAQTPPAQTNSQAPTDTAPAPAFGQNAPVLNPENPPVTGLDEPGLELRTASRSFVAPALQVSESADTNGANVLGGSGLEGVTRVLGAFDLQKFWPQSDLFLEYLGGGEFYSSPYEAAQLQAVGMEAVTRWRTGEVKLRDTFSYMPDGTFVIGYGGVPGLGIANGNFGGLPGGSLPGMNNPNGQLAPVGNIPRLANTAILEAVQALNPVSAITLVGGFGNSHFYDSTNCSISPNSCLINSDQVTVEGGYSHLLSRRDQIGAVYAFQLFQFPQATGGQIYLHIVNLRYSHTISGRLSLIVGAGPQYTDVEYGGNAPRWTLSARVMLRYKFSHSSVFATYEKYTSAGAGIFAGANVQSAGLGFQRPLGRTWSFYGDLGYSHDTQVQTVLDVSGASSFNTGWAGAVLRKHLGRTYEVFAAYHFGESSFSNAVPFSGAYGTGNVAQRQIGTVGVEWHPSPTRIE
ncbi:MAG TPA: hypothetical protein VIX14_00465 [Terriglobales bacterium]